jgi:23S rRNA A1618 N6-methylase RlmF
MKCIFNINWTLPTHNLCPRIPNRLNYLLWVNYHFPGNIKNATDIGTGASLIYPLLGWAVFKWKFLAL